MSERVISARIVLLAAAATVVLAAGGLGFVVGTTGQNRGRSMDLLVTQFQMSPLSMAAFGMVLTAVVFAVLFGLVSVASRYDETAGGSTR
jgi:hypothetical protein